MKSNNYRFLARGSLVLMVFSLLFTLFAVVFRVVESAAVQNLDEKKKERVELQEKVQGLTASRNEWRQVESLYQQTKKQYFRPFRRFTEFQGELNGLLQQVSLQVVRKEFGIENIRNEFARVRIHMTLEGPYPGFKQFLHRFREMKKVALISDLMLARKQEKCYGEVVLEVYFVR